MYNFFIEKVDTAADKYYITGQDYNHVKNVLRMKVGDKLLVSANQTSDLCVIDSFESDKVIVSVLEKDYQNTNLPINISLYQGLPKSDKLELIIQKTVELGVAEILPVQMSRSIVKLDKKSAKVERWTAISESAAKQSKRNSIPFVSAPLTFTETLERAKKSDLFLVPYESEEGMQSTVDALSLIKKGMSVSVLIGPEGGFSENEIKQAMDAGAKIISLGKRILRTETAAILSVGMLMMHAEMNL